MQWLRPLRSRLVAVAGVGAVVMAGGGLVAIDRLGSDGPPAVEFGVVPPQQGRLVLTVVARAGPPSPKVEEKVLATVTRLVGLANSDALVDGSLDGLGELFTKRAGSALGEKAKAVVADAAQAGALVVSVEPVSVRLVFIALVEQGRPDLVRATIDLTSRSASAQRPDLRIRRQAELWLRPVQDRWRIDAFHVTVERQRSPALAVEHWLWP